MAIGLIVLGAIITAVGGFLYWGNMSGTFVTFPYAGYAVMLVGGLIGASGYKKMHDDKQKQRQQMSGPVP